MVIRGLSDIILAVAGAVVMMVAAVVMGAVAGRVVVMMGVSVSL